MRKVLAATTAAILLSMAPLTGSAASAASSVDGLWMNPHNSVAVRTGACGTKLCGWVAWASPDALSDARESGVTNLIGTALLENYVPRQDGGWAGTVYVPDMGRRFASTISQVQGGLQIKGCILGGLICKSQLWHRIDQLPK